MKGTGLALAFMLSIIATVATEDQTQKDELLRLQETALDQAVEYFNNFTPLPRAFKLLSLEDSIVTVTDEEITFRLRFTLQQTHCKKKDFNKHKCKHRKVKERPRYCFACFKFEKGKFDSPIMFVDCVPADFRSEDRESFRQSTCERTMRGEQYIAGQFSLVRSHS